MLLLGNFPNKQGIRDLFGKFLNKHEPHCSKIEQWMLRPRIRISFYGNFAVALASLRRTNPLFPNPLLEDFGDEDCAVRLLAVF